MLFRNKQTLTDREREKTLKKVATKGVVQLFNAVKVQQKAISKTLEEAGPLDHRRERALNSLDKRSFLDVLTKGRRAKSELIDNPVKKEEFDEDDDDFDIEPKTEKSWGIFKDDFLTNKKMSNWDKSDEEDDEVDNKMVESDGEDDDDDDEDSS